MSKEKKPEPMSLEELDHATGWMLEIVSRLRHLQMPMRVAKRGSDAMGTIMKARDELMVVAAEIEDVKKRTTDEKFLDEAGW
jgi:hypothetical protein